MVTMPDFGRGGIAHSNQIRTLVAVMAMDVGGMLPVALSGALAGEISTDLAITPTRLAMVISSFFLTGSVTAMLVGAEIDRIGPHRTAALSSLGTVASVGLVALASSSAWSLTLALVVAGGSLSLTMPATNAILAHEIAAGRRAVAISAKQSAVPLALMLSGLALPAVSSDIGWRWIFVGAALFPLSGLLLLPRGPTVRDSSPRSAGWSAQRRVLPVGVSVLLASLLPGGATAFLALSLTEAGMTASMAAAMLVAGNSLGIVVRLVSGYWADRSGSDGRVMVAGMMLMGAVGAALLMSDDLVSMGIGSILALGLGWGWTGLTHFMVVRARPANAGAASAVVQSAGMLGSASGPLLMGAALPYLGLQRSWVVLATLTFVAGLLVAGSPRLRQP